MQQYEVGLSCALCARSRQSSHVHGGWLGAVHADGKWEAKAGWVLRDPEERYHVLGD